MASVEFYLEGFGWWADISKLEKFIRAIPDFVMFDGADDMAFDIGGNVSRAGIPSPSGYAPMRLVRYRISSYASVTAWDTSGKMRRVNQEAYQIVESNEEAPKEIYIPVGMLVDALLNNL